MSSRERRRALMLADDFADIAYVANATPPDVYRWYSDRPRERSYITWEIECPEGQRLVDYVAYRRKDPLIDLALARFGFSSAVLQRLYRRTSQSIRVALCANPELLNGNLGMYYSLRSESGREFAISLLEQGTDDEVRALCSCPDHHDWVYSLLLESLPDSESDSDVSVAKIGEDRFEQVLLALARNKRMQTERTSTPREAYRDGYADYNYTKPFQIAWELAVHLPANRRWADCLGVLYKHLPHGWSKSEEVLPLIEKWSPPKESGGGEATEKTHDSFAEVRSALIARHLRPEAAWADYQDSAFRLAFLETYDPLDESLRDVDPLEVDVDESSRFLQMEKNLMLWRLPRGRQAIREAGCGAEPFEFRWASELYDKKEAEFRIVHPEWFAEEQDYDTSPETPEESVGNKQLHRIVGQLERLKEKQSLLLLAVLLLAAIILYQLFR